MSHKILRAALLSGLFLAVLDACARIPGTPTLGSVSFGAGLALFVVYSLPQLIKKAKVNLSDAGLSEYKEQTEAPPAVPTQNSQAA